MYHNNDKHFNVAIPYIALVKQILKLKKQNKKTLNKLLISP